MVKRKIFQHFFSNFYGKRFVQIGANDGVYQDMLHYWVRKYNWVGVLVEPIAEKLEECKTNYSGCKGLTFENCVISEVTGEREFFYAPITTVSSAIKPVWKKLEGYLETGEYEKRIVPSLTFMDLLSKHGIRSVDVLCIDAEGYDGEIVESIDFGKCRPLVIIYEERNKGRKIERASEICSMLRDNGYKLTRYKNNRIAYRTSKKVSWSSSHIT